MTEITSKYANFEDLREQVVALHREDLSLRQIRGRLIIHVTKSADLYHRVEGTWYGIVLGAGSATG
ncbi:hypothetical protein OG520_24270 [Streptomyces sp. NBC_00984]|uniref:hypothetical protein n=1 Tax=Streptomyces sp. NBC_00984 TaxID=2903700 RepID=UPI0038656530|nr:hypothetical protein OG520_24270 [Streptomyces sp. NBC_00984]